MEILEREGLVERAGVMGRQLLGGLSNLADHPAVGEVRGLGLMCGVELVADRETKAPARMGDAVRRACIARGLIPRNKGDILMLAPPFIITAAEVDQMVTIVTDAIDEVWGQRV